MTSGTSTVEALKKYFHNARAHRKKGKPPEPERLREYYDREYVDAYIDHDYGNRIGRLLPTIDLRPTDKVLDVGCGSGLLAQAIAHRVGSYTGLDFSHAFIAEAEGKCGDIENASFHVADVNEWAWKNQDVKFDKIFLLDLTEHVYDADLMTMLYALRHVSHKDTRLYIHTPNRDFWWERAKEKSDKIQIPEHIAVRGPREYRALLSASGWENTKIKGIPHYLRMFKWMGCLTWLPVVGRFFHARLWICSKP